MPPADAALQVFRDAYARRHDVPSRDGFVGLLAACAPVELVVAAGLMPRRLFPDSSKATPHADDTMEPVFDGAIRSLYERFLIGDFADASLVVIPRAQEGMLQLHHFLQEVQREEPEVELPPTHFFDLLKTPLWATRRYVRNQLEDLQRRLASIAARPADERALAAAIALCNRQRSLFAEVNALRRERPSQLAGSDVLQIVGAAGVMPPQVHMAALAQLLRARSHLPLRAGPRLMVKGSAHDDLRFYNLLEEMGATIVADEHVNGERAFEGEVCEDAPPLEALTQHYHRQVATLRSLPQAAEDARFIKRAERAKVEGVVFFIEEHDDTLGWDLPAQRRQLDALQLPSIVLAKQRYREPDVAAQRAALGPWLRLVADGAREGAPA